MLMLEREINMPVVLIFPGPEPASTVEYNKHVSDLITQIQAAHEIARKKLKTSLAVARRDYDLKAFTNLVIYHW